MKPYVILPAIGLLVVGLAAAGITAWATSGKTERTVEIDRETTFTDQTGPRTFSYFLNFTPSDRERVIKVYYTFNTSVDQREEGTGGTVLITDLQANGKRAQAVRETVREPERYYDRRILRTEHITVPAGERLEMRVDVSSQPLPGPQADWAIRYHAMDWRYEVEAGPLWPAVLALAGTGLGAGVAWFVWANRRTATARTPRFTPNGGGGRPCSCAALADTGPHPPGRARLVVPYLWPPVVQGPSPVVQWWPHPRRGYAKHPRPPGALQNPRGTGGCVRASPGCVEGVPWLCKRIQRHSWASAAERSVN
jgi:hypothetical protein